MNKKSSFLLINSIHDQVKKIWQKIELEIGREVLSKLELEEIEILQIDSPLVDSNVTPAS